MPFFLLSSSQFGSLSHVGYFLVAGLAGVTFWGVGLAGAEAEPDRLRVRIPHTDSNAFLPGVPGFGRSHTMCA